MDGKFKQIFFSILLVCLPLLKMEGFGNFFARVPQYWMWVSGGIFLFALCQKNVWIKLFLIYALGLSVYLDKLNFRYSALFGLTTICLALFLVNLVQDMNENWLKVCVLYASYLVLYFWVINTFTLVLDTGTIKEGSWIGGAFLAFSIPMVFTSTDRTWMAILATIPLLVGCLYTKSTMAILSAYSGLVFVLIGKKKYLVLSFLLGATLIGVLSYSPENFKNFTAFPFRKKIWVDSVKYKKAPYVFRYDVNGKEYIINTKDSDRIRTKIDFLIGTGVRSYPGYEFIEGKDGKSITLVSHPHNSFLECFCEMGIVGLLIVIFFIFDLFTVKCPIEYKAMLLSIIIHCAGYYADKIAYTGLLIIICIGIIESYRRKEVLA